MLYAQGWEDVAHLKDEVATQQGKMDKLKTELAILEQAENSLKVGQLEGSILVQQSPGERKTCGCTYASCSLSCTFFMFLKDDLVKVRSEPQAVSKEIEAMRKEMV